MQDSTGEAASEAQKHLTLYELDLGLNHVVRKYSEPIDNGANMLVPVPGGADGPGGVLVRQTLRPCCFGRVIPLDISCALLWSENAGSWRGRMTDLCTVVGAQVCAENFVIYKREDHGEVRAVIPRRADLHPERGVLIVTAAMHKSKQMYFFLLQVHVGSY